MAVRQTDIYADSQTVGQSLKQTDKHADWQTGYQPNQSILIAADLISCKIKLNRLTPSLLIRRQMTYNQEKEY
jgi:hypothetical protein